MDLRITTSTVGDAHVVALDGAADIAAAPAMHAALARATAAAGGVHLVVDLDGLVVLDDVALGLILGAAARARAAGGSLTLACTRARLLDRIAATRLDAIVPVTSSITDSGDRAHAELRPTDTGQPDPGCRDTTRPSSAWTPSGSSATS